MTKKNMFKFGERAAEKSSKENSCSEVYYDNSEFVLEFEFNKRSSNLLDFSESNNSGTVNVTLKKSSCVETKLSLDKREFNDYMNMVTKHQGKSRDVANANLSNNATVSVSSKSYQKFSNFDNRNPYYKSNKYSENETYQLDSLFCGLDLTSKYTDESVFQSDSNYDYSTRPEYNRDEQIFTTSNMYNKLKGSLTCQRKESAANQKPGTPCLCQHCGMIGVLIESQKRPLIPHPPLRSRPTVSRSRSACARRERHRHRNREKNDQHTSYNHSNTFINTKSAEEEVLFEELLSKLKSLEERVIAQEEHAVGKDYFKYVIRKILSQYITKLIHSELPDDVKNSSTQYSRIYVHDQENELHKNVYKSHHHRHKSLEKTPKGNYRKEYDNDKNVQFEKQCHDGKQDNKYNTTQMRCNHSTNINVKEDSEALGSKPERWKWNKSDGTQQESHLRNKMTKLTEDNVKLNKPHIQLKPSLNLCCEHYKTTNEIRVEPFKNTLCLPQIIKSKSAFDLYCKSDKESVNRGDIDKSLKSVQLRRLLDNMSSQIYDDILSKRQSSSCNMDSFNKTKPNPLYPYDITKTMDDTIFKKNIQATKEGCYPRTLNNINYIANKNVHGSSKTPKYLINIGTSNNIIKDVPDNLMTEKRRELNFITASQNKMSNVKRETATSPNRKVISKDKLKNRTFQNKVGRADVTYLNPAVESWTESSHTEIVQSRQMYLHNVPKSKYKMYTKDSLTNKLEYLKELAKSKNINEDELWRSIWSQAKNQFKSKEDVLTIHIPSRKRNKRSIELELTWSDLKEITRSSKYRNKHFELSSSDILVNEKRKREQKKHQSYANKSHTYKKRYRTFDNAIYKL